jgi:putative membrane protein
MAQPFLTDAAKQALTDAVRDVESRCSAELVVAVRARSGSFLHADLLAGTAVALAVLTGLLFSPWPFDLFWFVIDPLLAGALGGLAASRLPAVRRALTFWRVRRRQVETAARATFVEKGVHATTGRTGVLIYISLLEHEAAVIHDLGIETLATTEGWRLAVDEIEEAVRRGEDGVAVAALVRTFGDLLAPTLVRGAEDVDELSNEVNEVDHP